MGNDNSKEDTDGSLNEANKHQLLDDASERVPVPLITNNSNISRIEVSKFYASNSKTKHSSSYTNYLAQMRAKYCKSVLNAVSDDDDDDGPKEDCDMGDMNTTLLNDDNSSKVEEAIRNQIVSHKP